MTWNMLEHVLYCVIELYEMHVGGIAPMKKFVISSLPGLGYLFF